MKAIATIIALLFLFVGCALFAFVNTDADPTVSLQERRGWQIAAVVFMGIGLIGIAALYGP